MGILIPIFHEYKMIKSYVYRCEHKETKRFYIGYRKANIVPARSDLGFYYFTSCEIIKQNPDDYIFEVLSEYDSAEMAYEVEQVLLYNLRNDPLLINGNNFRMKHHISLDPKPVQLERTKSKRKPKVIYSGPAKRSSPTPKSVKRSKRRARRLEKQKKKVSAPS